MIARLALRELVAISEKSIARCVVCRLRRLNGQRKQIMSSLPRSTEVGQIVVMSKASDFSDAHHQTYVFVGVTNRSEIEIVSQAIYQFTGEIRGECRAQPDILHPQRQ